MRPGLRTVARGVTSLDDSEVGDLGQGDQTPLVCPGLS